MQLVMDVGNTEMMIGLFRPPTAEDDFPVEAHWRLTSRPERTPDEMRLLCSSLLADVGARPSDVRRVVVGSVVPSVTDVLREAWADDGVQQVLVVDFESPLPIRLEVDDPRTVGADRIVNTLAAAHLYSRDTVVVDLGTATTFDCITADGAFLGGVISPGIRAGQEWLSGRTAKLPHVELHPPERVIGKRTEACLQSGIFYAAVDAVDGIVRRIRREWERPEAFVVATGGHARRIAPHSETVERVEPLLTLYGLELAGRHVAAVEGAG